MLRDSEKLFAHFTRFLQLVMVYSGAVWFLKPGFVKELLLVNVPAELTMLSAPVYSFGVITIKFVLAQTPKLTKSQTRSRLELGTQ